MMSNWIKRKDTKVISVGNVKVGGMNPNIAVSSGSACTSASLEPSYVLRALGRKDELAHSSIRFSFGRFTNESEVNKTLSCIKPWS